MSTLSLESIYHKLPSRLQQHAWDLASPILARRRYGHGYATMLAATLALDYADPRQVTSVAAARLSATCSSFGRLTQSNRSLEEVAHAESVTDLVNYVADQYPLMSKDDARSVSRLAVARRTDVQIRSSGTTGDALAFPVSRAADNRKWATWWRFRVRHGILPGEWAAYFGGRLVAGSPDRTSAQPWIIDRGQQRIYFSQYHMSAANVGESVELIRKLGIRWWHGYPSAIHDFVRLCEQSDIDLSGAVRPQWITVGAENPTTQFRDTVENWTGTVPIQSYGLAEGVANASECVRGVLHSDDDYCLVELRSTPGEGAQREIVGTSLWNDRVPLLRYRTRDIVHEDVKDCGCGLPFRSLAARIDGRLEDQILLADGRRVGRLDHIFKHVENVHRAQIVQSKAGCAAVQIELREPALLLDEAQLRSQVALFLGDSFEVDSLVVKEFSRQELGKHRLVLSRLNQNHA